MKIEKGSRIFDISKTGEEVIVKEGAKESRGHLGTLPSNQAQRIIILSAGNIMNGAVRLGAITITEAQYCEIKAMSSASVSNIKKEIDNFATLSPAERWENSEKMIAHLEKIQGYRISEDD